MVNSISKNTNFSGETSILLASSNSNSGRRGVLNNGYELNLLARETVNGNAAVHLSPILTSDIAEQI